MTRMSLAERRQKLIAAALQVIGREGVAAATTRAIAAEAGMPLASFHYAFESHQVLMVEALRELVTQELSRLDEIELTGSTERELVANQLGQHVADVEARLERYLTMLELSDHVSRVAEDHDVAAGFRRGRIESLQRALDEHRRSADVRLSHEPADLADIMVTMADGLTQTMVVTRTGAEARKVIDVWTAEPLAG